MPTFHYKAIDPQGAERTGTLAAADAGRAAGLLRQQGLFPTAIGLTTETVAGAPVVPAADVTQPAGWRIFGRRVGAKEQALFTRQLATLLRAGMPLLRGLEVLARQERHSGFRRVLTGLAEAIRSGATLSEAMERHPRVFDRLYLNMIRAGEMGGVPDVVLERLARFQEKSRQLKRRVGAALVYPLVLLAVAVAILAGLLVIVVPKFKQIFADLLKGAPLPPLTRFVLAVSDTVRSHAAGVVVCVVAVGLGLRYLRRTPRGARWLDGGLIRAPVLGELLLKDVVARFGRTLGTLLASGVPILPALLITRDTCSNRRVAAAIGQVHDQVKAGADVAGPLEAARVFPPMVTSLIAVGEHTGQLPEMLGKVADIYEEEVDTAVAGLSSLLEPLLIVFLAVVVGTIVIALFLPIIRIVQLLT